MQRRGADSLEGCFISILCCLISTLMFGSAGLSSMLFVAAINRYDTDRNQAAFPFILCNVLQAATGPFAGYFAKKYSERAVVLTGSFLAFVGIGTCFFAENITEVAVLWGVVFGAGFGFSTLLLPAIINGYFFKHRSKALGMCFLGSPIGFMIFPPIFEVLLNEYGLSGTFLLLSGINMHCIPLSILLKQPNFKGDSLNLPLNHGKEQITYSSTNSGTLDQKEFEKGKTAKKDKAVSNIKPSLRRFSFEFLWNSQSSQLSNEANKQYILILNKDNYGSISRSKSARSYERINKNHYENMSKYECNEINTSKSVVRNETTDGSKFNTDRKFECVQKYSNCEEKGTNLNYRCEVFDEFRNVRNDEAKQCDKMAKTSKELKEAANSKFTKIYNAKYLSSYKQYSAIYFGANQETPIRNKQKNNSELKSNFVVTNTANKSHENFSYHYNHSESGDIYHISSTTSIFPLITDTGTGNTPRSYNVNKSNTTRQWIANCKSNPVFNMYFNPIFILMSIANAIFNLQFSTLTTVIIDFSRDHNIDYSYEKFIMMCISVMGACGMLGFGWVTDGGYVTRNRFATICLLIGSVCIAVLPMTVGFTTLMIILALWCVSQSCFILLVPAIIAEYFEEDIQAIAVSACNVLCAPLYLIIPPLIGYFRDGKGSYDSIFYLLSGLSLLNSITVFIVPCIAKSRYAANR